MHNTTVCIEVLRALSMYINVNDKLNDLVDELLDDNLLDRIKQAKELGEKQGVKAFYIPTAPISVRWIICRKQPLSIVEHRVIFPSTDDCVNPVDLPIYLFSCGPTEDVAWLNRSYK